MRAQLIPPQLREWATASIRAIGRTLGGSPARRRRGLVIVHLDGVPRSVLDDSMASGKMPFLRSLIESGAYHLDRAFWGSPASTPCFQAGALYGLRHPNLPAYHWYDRELGRVVHMDSPRDTAAIEERLTRTATALLLEGGGAYLSLFRAGAANDLCMTSLADKGTAAAALLNDLRGLGSVHRPKGFTGLLGQLGREAGLAVTDFARWCYQIRDLRHERAFLVNRFLLLSVAWRLAHTRALIDMVRGVPNLYLVFGNFDEVAHRRGPLSPQALAELDRVDADLAELYAVARSLPRPYDLYIVTDHGHVATQPFEQCTGRGLEEYLATDEPVAVPREIERALEVGASPLPRIPSREPPITVNAGNFAHVYFHRGRRPMEAPEILALHGNVLGRVLASEEIGLVAVRRGNGAVAIFGGGVWSADEIARSPLPRAYSPEAVADLLREIPHMPTAGDLVLYGAPTDRGTVAFAWEFGSHGGLTRVETDSVVCWPADAPVDLGALSHATHFHERLSALYRS